MGLEQSSAENKDLFLGKSRLRALLVLMMMLICAQLINGGLTLLTFQGLQLDAANAVFEAVGVELQKDMERSLRFGKRLESFIGAETMLEDIRSKYPDLKNVDVSTLDGRVLYSLKEERVNQTLGKPLLAWDFEAEKQEASLKVELEDAHYIVIPLRKRSKTHVGYLILSYGQDLLERKSAEIIRESSITLAFTTAAATLFLFIGFQFLFAGGRRPAKKHLYLLIFVTVGCAQLTYSFHNISQFKASYLDLTKQKIETVSGFLRNELETLLERGLQLDGLVNVEKQLTLTSKGLPEVRRIWILDADKRELFGSDEKIQKNPSESQELDSEDGQYDVTLPIVSNQTNAGFLKVVIAEDVIRSKTQDILLDNLTTVALSFLFMMELMVFLFITVMKKAVIQTKNDISGDFLLIRPAIAIYVYAATLCYSFIPLYMTQIYQPILNFSKNFVLGLPISVEMLCGGIALIPVGYWIDRRGWHQPFVCGIVLSTVGTMMSGAAGSSLEFIVYRGLTGLGYGFCWMSAQGFILANSGEKYRARGLSGVFAGIFSGIICGSAMGGMLAERIGYSKVFFVSAMIMVLALVFVVVFMRGFFKSQPSDERADEHLNRRDLLKLFFDRNIILIFSCSVIPYSICMVGVLYYICPIYLNQLGTSQSTIGRVIMIYGLCMVYLAPQISQFVDRFENKKIFITLGGILGSAGMLTFYFFEGIWSVVFAVLVLGVSVSVSSASRNLFTIDQAISQRLGVSKVMGVYRSVDKLGQTLGPVLLGLLLIHYDIRQSVGIVGVVYIVMTLLFMAGVRRSETKSAIPGGVQ
ncbi:MAG: hypothetical protein C0616_13515 [Desulfuromonas sp.]|nr:MAG: hypothetical protein C0616_13515 [Desulfuromonas sp.]